MVQRRPARRTRADDLRASTLYELDAHTAVKHRVYRYYADCWIAKICNAFPQGGTIVDAFAAAGEYLGSVPGSPVHFANAFLDHSGRAKFRGPLQLVLIEKLEHRAEHLRGVMAGLRTDSALKVADVLQGAFTDLADEAARLAAQHGGPVLWVLDPYAKLAALPFDAVKQRLQNARHEVLITFFVQEVYRFARVHPDAYAAYMGEPDGASLIANLPPEHWSEGAQKNAITELYMRNLRAAGGAETRTGRFGVRVRNETPRYELIFATHSQAGMTCWTAATNRMDRGRGRGTSAGMLGQLDMFGPVLDPLDHALRALAGVAVSWSELVDIAHREGLQETHLRQCLDVLAHENLAARESPLESVSPWPEGCRVRFYNVEIEEEDPAG